MRRKGRAHDGLPIAALSAALSKEYSRQQAARVVELLAESTVS
jgi:hypothetical protein